MNRETIDILRLLNNDFYNGQHASFSHSRQSPWQGWQRLIGSLPHEGDVSVLDVACGNLRFERFAQETLGAAQLSFTCVDNCAALASDGEGVDCEFIEADVVARLADGLSGCCALDVAEGCSFDAVVSFGFMHHVPGRELRLSLLDSLLDCAKPGGIVAVSLWRFASDDEKRSKAFKTTADGLAALEARGHSIGVDGLESGDYLIGWNRQSGVYRYCHSFGSDEIDELVKRVSSRAVLKDRYRADGSSGSSNEYLVFQRYSF